MLSDAESESGIPPCDKCEDGGDVVEAPEAGYWMCTECGARGSGREKPVWWHNDPDSIWYDAPSRELEGEDRYSWQRRML